MRSKALIQADLLDTHNVYTRPLENFLEPSEVVDLAKIEYISEIDADSQSFGVSIKLQKLPFFHVFLSQNVCMKVLI